MPVVQTSQYKALFNYTPGLHKLQFKYSDALFYDL